MTNPAESPAAASLAAPALRWFKGNTHTHTLNSDGDASPGEVAQWYRDNGYDFLSITDHNVFTKVEVLQAEIDERTRLHKLKPFLLIPGEEVCDYYHVCSLNAKRASGVPGDAKAGVEALQHCVDATRQAGGVPVVCHPNFVWLVKAEQMEQLKNVHLFEVHNAHPIVHNFGGSGRLSTEEIWDYLLSRGKLFYGLGCDDAHHVKKTAPHLANPGRGWTWVRAGELTLSALMDALDRGDFYASSGVELEDVSRDDGTLRLVIKQHDGFGPYGYRTWFIGEGGKVLAEDQTLTPSYTLKPKELYVRARVMDSAGRYAWTQPAPGERFPAQRA